MEQLPVPTVRGRASKSHRITHQMWSTIISNIKDNTVQKYRKNFETFGRFFFITQTTLHSCLFLILKLEAPKIILFFSLYVFGEPAVHFPNFSPQLPLTEVSPQPSAIRGGNPPGDWQSAVGWGDTRFEPRTAGQQSGTLLLSYHASQK